jgi:hypothetical protein
MSKRIENSDVAEDSACSEAAWFYLAIGLGIGYATLTGTNGRVAVLVYVPIGLGALNTVIGIVMMIIGENDEARPS